MADQWPCCACQLNGPKMTGLNTRCTPQSLKHVVGFWDSSEVGLDYRHLGVLSAQTVSRKS